MADRRASGAVGSPGQNRAENGRARLWPRLRNEAFRPWLGARSFDQRAASFACGQDIFNRLPKLPGITIFHVAIPSPVRR
jgi:hypothetical protein